jgi:Transposase IS66 family
MCCDMTARACVSFRTDSNAAASSGHRARLHLSTLADWGGACAATQMPFVRLIRAHIFRAERIHADEMTVPVPVKVRGVVLRARATRVDLA